MVIIGLSRVALGIANGGIVNGRNYSKSASPLAHTCFEVGWETAQRYTGQTGFGDCAAAAVEVGVGDLVAGELHEHLVGAGGDDDGQEFAEGFFPGLTAGVWFQTEDVGHSKQLNRGRRAGALGAGLTLTRRAGKINTSPRIRRRAGVAGRVWAAEGGAAFRAGGGGGQGAAGISS